MSDGFGHLLKYSAVRLFFDSVRRGRRPLRLVFDSGRRGRRPLRLVFDSGRRGRRPLRLNFGSIRRGDVPYGWFLIRYVWAPSPTVEF